MNSGSESPKSDSPSPQPTLRGRKTLEGVCELANESAARLSALVAQVPNIPQPLAQQWEKQLKVLLNASCTEYKFALLGRTGSGKSTLTNCVLGAEILPTSAMRCVNGFARFKVSQLNFPSSCTAAITEVHYADSELVTAKISFVSHPVWEKEVKSLLKDISKKNADDKFAFKSLEKLVSVYPHLQGQDLSMVTHHQLSRCQPVNEYLGRTIRLPPTTQEDFRESLERYVSTTRTDSLALGNATSTLWPLVTKVQIFGKFDILSSGIILADLPGHGDDDAVRNAIATEYMKEADGAVLVADVKRVYSDHDTQKHLRDTLAQVLCDGRDPEDFVVLVATGCDTRIGDNEVPLSEESKIRVAALNEKLRETCQPSPLKRQKTSADSERRRGTSSEFRELEMEKAKIYAQTRNNFVRKSVQEPLQDLKLQRTIDAEVPQLPIFCAGCRDYLLKRSGLGSTAVFANEADTEIPALVQHFQTTGERRQLNEARRILGELKAMTSSIQTYFPENGKTSFARVSDEAKSEARLMLRKMGQKIQDEADFSMHTISGEFDRLKSALRKGTKDAARNAPKALERLGGQDYATYRACMRHDGVYYTCDLNRDLTVDILSSIRGDWSGALNNRIPLRLKDMFKIIEETTMTTVQLVVGVLHGDGAQFREHLALAFELNLPSRFDDLQLQACDELNKAQREASRSFPKIIQNELREHYASVAKLAGSGAKVKMQQANLSFFKYRGRAVFGTINESVEDVFDTAFETVEKMIRKELYDIVETIRSALTEHVDLAEVDDELAEEVTYCVGDIDTQIESWHFVLK